MLSAFCCVSMSNDFFASSLFWKVVFLFAMQRSLCLFQSPVWHSLEQCVALSHLLHHSFALSLQSGAKHFGRQNADESKRNESKRNEQNKLKKTEVLCKNKLMLMFVSVKVVFQSGQIEIVVASFQSWPVLVSVEGEPKVLPMNTRSKLAASWGAR